MAFRRRLGDIAEVFLKSHLAARNQEHESELIGQRQKELAGQNQEFQILQDALKNPDLAFKLKDRNPLIAQIAPGPQDAYNKAATGIDSISDLSKLPTDPDVAFHAQPGAPDHQDGVEEPWVGKLRGLIQARTGSIPAGLTQTSQATAQGGINAKNANFPTELAQIGDVAQANAYNSAAGTEQAAAENEPAVLGRKANEGLLSNQLDLRHQTQLNPILAARAGAEANARIPAQEQLASFNNDLAKSLEEFKNSTNVTASTKTMMEGAQMLLPHVKNVTNMAQALDNAGLFGPIMSRVRKLGEHAGTIEEFENAINTDPELQRDRNVGKFATELALMASGFGRVHGGSRGGGAISMINYMKQVLDDQGSLPMFLGRMDSVNGYLQGYANGPHGPQPSINIDVNPLVQTGIDKLNRRKPQGPQ